LNEEPVEVITKLLLLSTAARSANPFPLKELTGGRTVRLVVAVDPE
jgi:hypothetical protein